MFKSLRNIETTFKQIRLYAIVFAVLCFGIVVVTLIGSWQLVERQREGIYVLDEGKSLMLALRQDASLNRPVEAREHVRRFHELFFTLAPESEAIESNIKRALELADRSAFNYYNDLAESRYYHRLISSRTNQTIRIDSIIGDYNVHPYQMTTYARQFIYRRSNVTERSLVTHCNLRNTVRSDVNPQGFLIEDFRVLLNEDIKVKDKRG